jgi:hypothetical protein
MDFARRHMAVAHLADEVDDLVRKTKETLKKPIVGWDGARPSRKRQPSGWAFQSQACSQPKPEPPPLAAPSSPLRSHPRSDLIQCDGMDD